MSLVCLFVLGVGAAHGALPRDLQGGDFIHTYRAALAIRAGVDPYGPAVDWVNAYQSGDPLQNEYFYPPTFATLLVPLTWLPYQVALTSWGGCVIALLGLSVWALLQAAGVRRSRAALLPLVAAASLTTSVRAELYLGQANVFMLACLCCALWARVVQRIWLAAVLLGLAFVTKPMLLVVLAFLLWKREFTLVAASIVATLGLFIVPFLWLGSGAFADLAHLWRFYSTQYISFSENVAPRGLLERLLNVNPFVAPIAVAPWLAIALWLAGSAFVAVLCLAALSPRPLHRETRSVVEFGTVISAALLISPLTESPYFVLLTVPWVGTAIYVYRLDRQGVRVGASAAWLAVLWALLLIPRQTGGQVWLRFPVSPLAVDVLATVAPAMLILVGTFALQLHVLRLASMRWRRISVAHGLQACPHLLADWLHDLRVWSLPSARSLS